MKYAKRFLLIAIAWIGLTSLFAFPSVGTHSAKSVEVIHWWTSGGESKAVEVLKSGLAKKGYIWEDSSVTGGDEQRKILKTRIHAHIYPDAMQMQGIDVINYASQGFLGNLDTVAAQENWAEVIPTPIQKIIKYKGHWVAVPVNIHRANWIWANKKIFDELKLTPPKNFDELVIAANKIRKAGYIPLAHGGQPWQDLFLFDNAVLSVGGPSFYKQALIDLNLKALGSKNMLKVFQQLKKLRGMVDNYFEGRDWNFATAMIIHNKAAMQVMGDWTKGEFLKAHKKPNIDFLCFPYPGTTGNFIFISDLFGMFNVHGKRIEGQKALASVIMDKDTQIKFNLAKGSIPVRTDISMDQFDDCARQSAKDLKQAIKNNTMISRFDIAIPDRVQTAIKRTIDNFFESSDNPSPEEGVKQLVAAVKASTQAEKVK